MVGADQTGRMSRPEGAASGSHRLDELSWPQLETALERTRTLLIPVGSTEQHGYHLPLGVDNVMPERIAEAVAEEMDCLVAPTIPYGVAHHHTFKPGTFTVDSETFRRYVRQVCASAGDWGIEHVLLLNGHYLAQDPELEIVVRDLRRDTGLRAFHVPLVSVFAQAAAEVRTSTLAFHAAEFETSLMLDLRPDLVDMDVAEAVSIDEAALPLTDWDALGENKVGWALNREEMDRLTPVGNIGDPTDATAAKGRALREAAVENICSLVSSLEA